MEDRNLQEKVRNAIRDGALPSRQPQQVLGGAATGGSCTFCGESTWGGVEIELVFAGDGRDGERTYYAHPRCFSTFQREIDALSGRSADLHDHAAAD
jgi:hypothetical protein